MISVTNDRGRTFNVRLVRKGEAYGREGALRHDKIDPLVEFFDTTHKRTPLGQLVSRYFASTLLAADPGGGLNLDGGVPEWQIGPDERAAVLAWLDSEGILLVQYGTIRNQNTNHGGWLPAIWHDGVCRSSTWAVRSVDKDEALAAAKARAEEICQRYSEGFLALLGERDSYAMARRGNAPSK